MKYKRHPQFASKWGQRLSPQITSVNSSIASRFQLFILGRTELMLHRDLCKVKSLRSASNAALALSCSEYLVRFAILVSLERFGIRLRRPFGFPVLLQRFVCGMASQFVRDWSARLRIFSSSAPQRCDERSGAVVLRLDSGRSLTKLPLEH